MSVRNLDKLFKPQTVALIGATPRPGSVGAVVVRNLRRAGFAGELMLVNPHRQAIDGLTVHPECSKSAESAGPRGHHHAGRDGSASDRRAWGARHARCHHYYRGFRRGR